MVLTSRQLLVVWYRLNQGSKGKRTLVQLAFSADMRFGGIGIFLVSTRRTGSWNGRGTHQRMSFDCCLTPKSQPHTTSFPGANLGLPSSSTAISVSSAFVGGAAALGSARVLSCISRTSSSFSGAGAGTASGAGVGWRRAVGAGMVTYNPFVVLEVTP